MTDLYADQILRGLDSLDETPLVGIVLADDYVFDADHDTAEILATYEVSGTGYARATAMARVERVGGSWKLFIDDMTNVDLSDVDDRGGIAWVIDTGLDSTALTVGWAADPGAAIDPYTPTWPDGFYELPIETIDDRLDSIEASITALEVGAGGLDIVNVDLIIAADAIDGTGNEFATVLRNPTAGADGIVPDGWEAPYGSADAATFGASMTTFYPSGVTVLALSGAETAVYSFTGATIGDPWTLVAASALVVQEGQVGVEAVDDGAVIRLDAATLGIIASEVAGEFTGILTGYSMVEEAMAGVEGFLDGERHVRGYFSTMPPAITLGDPVADIGQPVTDDGEQVVKGDLVVILDDVDWVRVVDIDTGAWGNVPGTGASTPPEAAEWSNAISTNQVSGGNKFYGPASHGVFLGYRDGVGAGDIIRGGPSRFADPEHTGRWDIYENGTGGGGGTGYADLDAITFDLDDVAPSRPYTELLDNDQFLVSRSDSGYTAARTTLYHVRTWLADVLTAADIGAATASDITSAIDALIASAPGALNTLDELAAALGDDANFASTVTTALAGKVSTARTLAGLDLSADRTAAALRAALGLRSVVLASDVASNVSGSGLTAVDITGGGTSLSVSYVSGDRLPLRGEIFYTGDAAIDARIGATFTNATLILDVEGIDIGASSFPANRAVRGTITSSAGYVEVGCQTGGQQRASLRGSLVASGSGTLQLTIAQRSTGATATTVKAGSTFVAEPST